MAAIERANVLENEKCNFDDIKIFATINLAGDLNQQNQQKLTQISRKY